MMMMIIIIIIIIIIINRGHVASSDRLHRQCTVISFSPAWMFRIYYLFEFLNMHTFFLEIELWEVNLSRNNAASYGRRDNAASLTCQVREQLRIVDCLSVWQPLCRRVGTSDVWKMSFLEWLSRRRGAISPHGVLSHDWTWPGVWTEICGRPFMEKIGEHFFHKASLTYTDLFVYSRLEFSFHVYIAWQTCRRWHKQSCLLLNLENNKE